MPYIILKRSDIPAATLQVLDLAPNTSQRNLIYDPPGQTKYVDPVQNDPVVTTTSGGGVVSMFGARSGLAAWFLTNVTNGAGLQSAGTVTIAAGNAAAGDTVTIGTAAAGGPSRTFTFSTAPTSQLQVLIGATAAGTAANLNAAINNVNNGLTPYVEGTVAAGVVTVTAVQEGTAGDGITLAKVGANIAVAAMAGGADAAALSVSDANDNATNILTDLLRYGNLTLPALDLDAGSINGAMVNGSITGDQVSEVLNILAGRHYQVPNGTVIETTGVFGVSPAVGAPGGPGFVAGTLRNIYSTGSLTLSFAMGELEGFTDSAFIYAGVAGTPNGEAVAVFNDDGTLYTP